MPHQDRATLDRRLADLEAQLPTLIAETSPESLMDAFAGIADENRAALDQVGHTSEQLQQLSQEQQSLVQRFTL